MPIKSHITRFFSVKLIRHRVVAYFLDWCAFALSGLIAFELRFDGALPRIIYIRWRRSYASGWWQKRLDSDRRQIESR